MRRLLVCLLLLFLFFFHDTATTEIYTLSLHDALPILPHRREAGEKPPCCESPSSAHSQWGNPRLSVHTPRHNVRAHRSGKRGSPVPSRKKACAREPCPRRQPRRSPRGPGKLRRRD